MRSDPKAWWQAWRPRLGWGLLVVGLALVIWALTTGDLATAAAWANIIAVPVGVALVLQDRHSPASVTRRPDVERQLAERMQASKARHQARLVGVAGQQIGRLNLRYSISTDRYRQAGGADDGDLDGIADYYQALSPGRMVILGAPGTGKTVAALEVLLQLLQCWTSEGNDAAPPVPVWLSLTAWRAGHTFEEWLCEQLVTQFDFIDRGTAADLVDRRRILPVLDGLDEMDADPDSANRATAAVNSMNLYTRDNRQRAPLVVTCRPAFYEKLSVAVDEATHIKLAALAPAQVETYLQRQFQDIDERNRWRAIMGELAEDQNGLLAAYLRRPWRLALAVNAGRRGGDPCILLPTTNERESHRAGDNSTTVHYVERITSALVERYLSNVSSASPHRHQSPETLRTWLSQIATHLHREAGDGRSGTDLLLERWWTSSQRRRVHIGHTVVNVLVGFPVVLLTVMHSAANGWFRAHPPIQALLAWLSVAVILEILLVAAWQPDPHPSRISIRHLQTAPGRRRLVVGLQVGFLAAIVSLVSHRWVISLALGLALFMIIGVLLHKGSAGCVGPRDALRYDLYSGVTAGIVVGLAAAPLMGFATAAAVCVATAVVFATCSMRYLVAITLGALGRCSPLRFGQFLDWAYDAGLLRISGIAFQFRHQELQTSLNRHQLAGAGE